MSRCTECDWTFGCFIDGIKCQKKHQDPQPAETRQVDASLVIIRFLVDGVSYHLFRRNYKWNDWSLVGGHVEPGEENLWDVTAAREVEEEMQGLKHKENFSLVPLLWLPVMWGPVMSKHANVLTNYRTQFFALKFLVDPLGLLKNLPKEDFKLVPETMVGITDQNTGQPARVLRNHIGGEFSGTPWAWTNSIPREIIKIDP